MACVLASPVRGQQRPPDPIPLPPVEVSATSQRLAGVGFYERAKRGSGTFIGRQKIEASSALFSSDLLRTVPGIRIVNSSRRGTPRTFTLGRGSCRFRFIVDGARMLPDYDLDMLSPRFIEGIEVYSSVPQVPAQFRALAGEAGATTCGVIVVWTKDGRS